MYKNFWKCPKCGRNFIKQNQYYSCISIPIDNHFKNKVPKLKAIFNSLRQKIEEFGSIRVDPVKTSIYFSGKSQFCAIYILKKSIKLDFILNIRINSSRIIRIKGPTNTYYTHTLKLKDLSDVDEELIGWLKDSLNLRNQ